MTLTDTSALVMFIRGSGGPVDDGVQEAIDSEAIAITDPITMELLAGARDHDHLRELSNFLAGAQYLPVGGPDTWEAAAALYRACRGAGFTPRNQIDCLIAAVAIREGVPVLHADRDFDLIAEHTPLRVVATDE